MQEKTERKKTQDVVSVHAPPIRFRQKSRKSGEKSSNSACPDEGSDPCLQNASEDVVVIVWSLVDGVVNQDEDDDVGNLELV